MAEISLSGKSKDEVDSVKKSNDSETTKNPQISMQAINETTPESQIIQAKLESMKNLVSAREKLKFGYEKPKNFKLSTLYMHLLDKEAKNVHIAEGDCITMMRCVNQLGLHFAESADHHVVSLNLFKKKYFGIPPSTLSKILKDKDKIFLKKLEGVRKEYSLLNLRFFIENVAMSITKFLVCCIN